MTEEEVGGVLGVEGVAGGDQDSQLGEPVADDHDGIERSGCREVGEVNVDGLEAVVRDRQGAKEAVVGGVVVFSALTGVAGSDEPFGIFGDRWPVCGRAYGVEGLPGAKMACGWAAVEVFEELEAEGSVGYNESLSSINPCVSLISERFEVSFLSLWDASRGQLPCCKGLTEGVKELLGGQGGEEVRGG